MPRLLLPFIIFGIALNSACQIPGIYIGPYASALRIQIDPFAPKDSLGETSRFGMYCRNDFGIPEYSGIGLQYIRSGLRTNWTVHGYAESLANWKIDLLIRQSILSDLRVTGGLYFARHMPLRFDPAGIRIGMTYSGLSGWMATQELIWTEVINKAVETRTTRKLRLQLSRVMPDRTRLSGEFLIYSGGMQLTSSISIYKRPWEFHLSSGIAPATLALVLVKHTKSLTIATGISHHQKLGASPMAAFELER